MLVFLRRRLANLVVMMFVVTAGMFFLLHLAPGSPVNTLPPAVAADPVARAAYARSLGLDENVFLQFWHYLTGLAHGDFGRSLYDGSPVLSQIESHLPVSLELGALAAVGAMLPGFLLGAWTAMHRGKWLDSASRVFTVLSLSVPAYWLAVLSLVFIGRRYPDLLPNAGGYITFGDDPVGNLKVMFLPALVLGLSTFALVARSLRASLVEVMSRDYVTFAEAMGMKRRRVMWRIAIRNAIIPTLTVMGVLLGGLISGTVLVESIYQIPGLGQLMVTAFLRQDYPLAVGCSVFTALIFLSLNLVVDLLYYLVDPRTRAEGAAKRAPRVAEPAGVSP